MTPPPSRPGRRYALALAAALAFAALYLHVSARGGRLSMDLQYDDVVYAVDAADRLDTAVRDGAGAMVRSFAERPPHSIVSTVQAMAAFSVAGFRDGALYASNAWMLVALALGIAAAFRDRHPAAFGVALAFGLTSPLAYFAMAEFRPDIALGLTTALMAWFLVQAALERRPRRAGLAGLMLAASLVVKPTFFAHTLALATGLATALWLAGRYAASPRLEVAFPVRLAALFLGIGIAAAFPFYLVNGAEAIGYFWTHTFGAKGGVWIVPRGPQSPWQLLQLFWPSMFWLSRYDLEAAVAGTLAVATWLAWHRQPGAVLRIALLLGLAALSAAIVIAGRQESPYFFATMHWLVLFAALFAYARFEDVASAAGRIAGRAVMGAGLVALAVVNSALPAQAFPPESLHGRSWNERAARLIRDDLERDPPARVASVYVPSAGVVNALSMRWVARKQGTPLAETPAHVLEGLEEAKRDAAMADYLVIPNTAIANSDGWLPIGPARKPLLDWVRTDGRFRALAPIDATQAYHVFANDQGPARRQGGVSRAAAAPSAK